MHAMTYRGTNLYCPAITTALYSVRVIVNTEREGKDAFMWTLNRGQIDTTWRVLRNKREQRMKNIRDMWPRFQMFYLISVEISHRIMGSSSSAHS